MPVGNPSSITSPSSDRREDSNAPGLYSPSDNHGGTDPPTPPIRGKFTRLLFGDKPDETNRTIALATLVIAFGAIVQIVVAIAQYCEMRSGGAQTGQIITTANQIKDALNTANGSFLSGLGQTLEQSQHNADIANSQNQNALNASLAEMRRQRTAMEQAAQAAIDQDQISENQASARLTFEHFNGIRSSDGGARITFDLVNDGDSEATEIGEESSDGPAASNPSKDEQLIAEGRINPSGDSLKKGDSEHIEIEVSKIPSPNPAIGVFAWYAYRKYTYLDIFQRTKEACILVFEHKERIYKNICPPEKRERQNKPN